MFGVFSFVLNRSKISSGMKLRFGIVFLVWGSSLAYSASPTLVESSQEQSPQDRLEYFYSDSRRMLMENPSQAWQPILEGLELAERRNDEEYLGRFYYLKGYYLYNQPDSVVEAFVALGNSMYWTQRTQETLTYYKALEIRAHYHAEYKNPEEAEQDYLECLEYYQQIDDKLAQSRLYRNLGEIALNHKEYAKAQQYFSHALLIRQALKDSFGIATMKNYLGWIYNDSNNPTMAIGILKEAYQEIANQTSVESSSLKASIKNNLSNAYYSIGEYETSLSHLQSGLAELAEGADPVFHRQLLNNTAHKHMALEQWQEAEALLLEALKLETTSFSNEILHTYTLGVQVYKHQENYARALELEEERNGVEQAMQLRQSEQLAELRRVQIATAQAELELLDQARRQAAHEQEWYGILVILVASAFGIFGFLTWRYRRLHKRARAEAALWPKLHGQVEELARMLQIGD